MSLFGIRRKQGSGAPKSRFRRLMATGAGAATLVLVWGASPASAMGTWYSLTPSFTSACNYAAQGYKVTESLVSTVGNDGVLSRGYVNGSSYHWANLNCNTAPVVTYFPIYGVDTTWEIAATGWGIDSCGVSIPAGVFCGGSASTKTATFRKTWPRNSKYGTITLQNFYFDAGSVGDISKISETVTQMYCNSANNCKTHYISQASGNIQ